MINSNRVRGPRGALHAMLPPCCPTHAWQGALASGRHPGTLTTLPPHPLSTHLTLLAATALSMHRPDRTWWQGVALPGAAHCHPNASQSGLISLALRCAEPRCAAPRCACPLQDVVAGDGTTSVTVIAGALLRKSLELLERGVHPTIISDAFNKAAQKACEVRAVHAVHAVRAVLCMLRCDCAAVLRWAGLCCRCSPRWPWVAPGPPALPAEAAACRGARRRVTRPGAPRGLSAHAALCMLRRCAELRTLSACAWRKADSRVLFGSPGSPRQILTEAAIPVSIEDRESLIKAANTSLGSKIVRDCVTLSLFCSVLYPSIDCEPAGLSARVLCRVFLALRLPASLAARGGLSCLPSSSATRRLPSPAASPSPALPAPCEWCTRASTRPSYGPISQTCGCLLPPGRCLLPARGSWLRRD